MQDPLSEQDEAAFDALLAPDNAGGAAPNELASAGGPVATHSIPHEADHAPHDHLAGPTWEEFVAGWDLYQAPILCGAVAGLTLGVLGVFIVLRRAVFVTAAVSQSAALGVALAFLIQIHVGLRLPPIALALVLALAATGLLAWRPGRWVLPRETMVGFGYLAASAAAILVGDRITQEAHDIASILFGTAVLVRPADLIAVLVASGIVVSIVIVCYRGFLFAGFDAESARIQGLPVRVIEFSLWFLVALEVSVTTRALGALPVFAFAVLPAMTALLVVERMHWALIVAGLVGAVAAGLGYLFAFFNEFPVGASQAALATLCFMLALPFSRRRSRTAVA